MPEVRIVSDGTSNGTHVYDADGREFRSVTGVQWGLNVEDGAATATVTFFGAELDCEADDVKHIATVHIPRKPAEGAQDV